MNDEYIPMPQHPKKKYQSEYIGIVEPNSPHDKYLRVKVRVFGLFDEVPAADLPWAIYRLPVGSRVNDGFFTPAKPGDYVWVDFPFGGDTRRPRITGSVHYAPGETPNMPDEAWTGEGQGDKCRPVRTGLEKAAPESRIESGLPCIYKQNGVCVEILGEGTIRITNTNHVPDPDNGNKECPGSNIEIDKYGKITIHAVNSIFLSSHESLEAAFHKDSCLTVLGDKIQSVHGDVTENTKGAHNLSAVGQISIVSDSTITIKAPMVEIN